LRRARFDLAEKNHGLPAKDKKCSGLVNGGLAGNFHHGKLMADTIIHAGTTHSSRNFGRHHPPCNRRLFSLR
jgi:hypothetical protein